MKSKIKQAGGDAWNPVAGATGLGTDAFSFFYFYFLVSFFSSFSSSFSLFPFFFLSDFTLYPKYMKFLPKHNNYIPLKNGPNHHYSRPYIFEEIEQIAGKNDFFKYFFQFFQRKSHKNSSKGTRNTKFQQNHKTSFVHPTTIHP